MSLLAATPPASLRFVAWCVLPCAMVSRPPCIFLQNHIVRKTQSPTYRLGGQLPQGRRVAKHSITRILELCFSCEGSALGNCRASTGADRITHPMSRLASNVGHVLAYGQRHLVLVEPHESSYSVEAVGPSCPHQACSRTCLHSPCPCREQNDSLLY